MQTYACWLFGNLLIPVHVTCKICCCNKNYSGDDNNDNNSGDSSSESDAQYAENHFVDLHSYWSFGVLSFQSAQALALGLFPPSSPSSGKSQVVDINVMDKDYDDMEPNPRYMLLSLFMNNEFELCV